MKSARKALLISSLLLTSFGIGLLGYKYYLRAYFSKPSPDPDLGLSLEAPEVVDSAFGSGRCGGIRTPTAEDSVKTISSDAFLKAIRPHLGIYPVESLENVFVIAGQIVSVSDSSIQFEVTGGSLPLYTLPVASDAYFSVVPLVHSVDEYATYVAEYGNFVLGKLPLDQLSLGDIVEVVGVPDSAGNVTNILSVLIYRDIE